MTETLHDADSNLISSLTNTWDGDGNMLSQTDGTGTKTVWTYDANANV